MRGDDIHICAFLQSFAHVQVQLVIYPPLDQRDHVDRLKHVGDDPYLRISPTPEINSTYDQSGIPSLFRIGTLDMLLLTS